MTMPTPFFQERPAQLTAHQREVLNYISEFQRRRGYSPSLSDLAIAFGVRSKNSMHKVVNVLCATGHLEKDQYGRIKILPLERPKPPLKLPIILPKNSRFFFDMPPQPLQ